MDGPSKGLRVKDQEAKKQCLPENCPSSSTCEMDNSTVWSQRSMPPAQSQNSHSNIGSSTDFVNSGLLLWNETRKQWVGNKMSESQKQVQEPKISWNATYDSLLTTNKPFPEPIPLAEMIEFLVDVWEQEGLYDWACNSRSFHSSYCLNLCSWNFFRCRIYVFDYGQSFNAYSIQILVFICWIQAYPFWIFFKNGIILKDSLYNEHSMGSKNS